MKEIHVRLGSEYASAKFPPKKKKKKKKQANKQKNKNKLCVHSVNKTP